MILKKREFLGMENLPDEPFVSVGNHCQMYGPLIMEIYFPTKKHIWCTSEMMTLKEVPAYAYKEFWSNKPKILRPLFKLLSYIIAPIAAYLFNSADALPVYHDRRIIKTMESTVEGLINGENAVIFPERHERYNNILCDFQTGFVDVARLYYAKTKRPLAFVPTYNAVMLKKVLFGTPIYFDPKAPVKQERERICAYLKEEITRLALTLPPHKVVPYENLARKDFPISKEG